MTALAPAPRAARRRRLLGWGALAGAVVLLGAVAAVISDAGSWSDLGTLDPESPGPDGARAVARVLEQEGVDVRITRDAEGARAALGPDTTLLLPDAPGLADAELAALADAATTVVLVEPRSATLDALLPGSSAVSFADDEPIAPDCGETARAGEIVAGEIYAPGPDVTGCYPYEDGFALLHSEDAGHTVWAVDGRALLANDVVTRAGNASLALTLLGAHPTVVWYMPSLADATGEGAPTLGELTPRWVTPVAVLLIVAAVVAAFWRGRRFGPLVSENLPVTVRGSETSVGRGRLYAAARDAPHALEQLRRASRRRLAAHLGLAPHTPAGDIADAAATRLGADRAAVRSILIDAVPADDRALVALDARLRDLESRVRTPVRGADAPAAPPEGNTP
jgi:hypothetical protein